ncbi:TetR/AcrR family transcriptional regulator [Roseovarius indicus]|uniref:HTH-type transcriptional repressor AcnR n=1 Tax=Roseovarius indicus TaxID=540747 RepID=A0A0T5PFG5_9RHOB|nr:TetR/AcrR family transcriptional regulator [Roseovarius indicus]KRS19772.1 TetR family transcriptional regulator [Roseovarius indicus]OAO10510.1 TetR family transcriptional regulator [Roseovarius indicus]QEW28870.1 HTH-type transcriptional repressor AcnR [Roseovarius indicus]SFD83258.1 transcriptional regulator, TetR family [Roseovarius indicus]
MTAMAAEIKKGRKFDQVLDGAREIFLRDGFEGASVDEIARAAGVSKATLYSYFPDKRLLFSEVARIECNRQAEEALDVIGTGAPIEVVLHEAANRIVRFFLSEFGRQVFRICVSESYRFPELGRRFYESGPQLVRERMTKVLTPYVEQGILKIDDMDLAANQFGELCKADLFVRNLCGVCNDFHEADIERVVNGAVEMFLARYRV